MSFPYINSAAEYTPVFPGSTFTPIDYRNQNDSPGYAVTGETFTVPASADAEGRYRVHLAHVPLENITMAITLASVVQVKIDYGQTPGAGQVAVSLISGVLEFPAGAAGLSGTATYTGRGTPITAYDLIRLGKELAAVESLIQIAGMSRPLGAVKTSQDLTAAGSITLLTSPSSQVWTLDRIIIRGQNISGVTSHPVVEPQILAQTAWEPVELLGMANNHVYEFSGPGLRRICTSGVAIALNVSTPAVASSYLVDIWCEGTRRS